MKLVPMLGLMSMVVSGAAMGDYAQDAAKFVKSPPRKPLQRNYTPTNLKSCVDNAAKSEVQRADTDYTIAVEAYADAEPKLKGFIATCEFVSKPGGSAALQNPETWKKYNEEGEAAIQSSGKARDALAVGMKSAQGAIAKIAAMHFEKAQAEIIAQGGIITEKIKINLKGVECLKAAENANNKLWDRQNALLGMRQRVEHCASFGSSERLKRQ